MKNVVVFIGLAMLCLISCKKQEVANKEENVTSNRKEVYFDANSCPDFLMKRKNENLNISILLDLSNRIDVLKQQSKDSAYIASLSRVFNAHINKKKLGLLYDKMEVYFEPVPIDDRINEMSSRLKVSYVKGVSKKEWMPKTLKLYNELPSNIYELAREGSKGSGYPGSDTWRFIKDHVKDYCIDSCHRNILVILTDGYMFHKSTQMKEGNKTSYLTPISLKKLRLDKSDWKEEMKKRDLGFIPATDGLGDLEVLVIGIQSQNPENPYAQDVIEAYWSQWFETMGVKNYKIKNADLPANVEKVINDFILNTPL